MAGPPHHTRGSGSPVAGLPRFSQRRFPSPSNAMRPPCECALGGWLSFGSQLPVTRQSVPSPLQSPAAIDEFASMMCSKLGKSFGAVQMADPSEPRMARMIPAVSSAVSFELAVKLEKVLKTMAGSGSSLCNRITTGVDITSLKSRKRTSLRTLPPMAGSSGPRGDSKGHHQACTGGSKAPCGMKMQAGSAGLHCAVAGRHWPFAQNVPAGQATFAHAFGCCCVCGIEQVPSDWQRPSAQSESLVHRFWPVPALPEVGLPLPHPATTIATAKNSPETPRPPIAHLRPNTRVVAKEVVIGGRSGKRPLERSQSGARQSAGHPILHPTRDPPAHPAPDHAPKCRMLKGFAEL